MNLSVYVSSEEEERKVLWSDAKHFTSPDRPLNRSVSLFVRRKMLRFISQEFHIPVITTDN